MAYSPTTWTNGSTKVNATNMNKIENGIVANDQSLTELRAEYQSTVGDLQRLIIASDSWNPTVLSGSTMATDITDTVNTYGHFCLYKNMVFVRVEIESKTGVAFNVQAVQLPATLTLMTRIHGIMCEPTIKFIKWSPGAYSPSNENYCRLAEIATGMPPFAYMQSALSINGAQGEVATLEGWFFAGNDITT